MYCTVRMMLGLGVVMALALWWSMPAPAQQPGQPYLVCGEAVECAYAIWDNHGNKNTVVEGPTGREYLPTNYIGMKYCMDAGPPRMPTPKWPECFNEKSRHLHLRGVIRAGQNG
jgi:hypothetical protein